MTEHTVSVIDVVHEPHGSKLTLDIDGTVAAVEPGGLGAVVVARTVASLRDDLASGATLADALSRLERGDAPHRTQRLSGVNGALLLDDTDAATPDDVRESLRVLADLGRAGMRTVAVIGELRVDDGDSLVEHDALGRIVVRLNIAQLVVIGAGARHLHMAAGLEGSWDGESVLFDTAATAYDFVRATTGPNTVILVSGGTHRAELAELVGRLQEERS